MKLNGKVAIITGASSGIGKEIALAYDREGAKVIAVARRIEKLKELENLAENKNIEAFEGDVSVNEDIQKVIEYTLQKYGAIDILVNNAGILDDYQAPHNITDERWEKVFDVNVNSIMKMTRGVLSSMRERKKGVIINTTSVGGLNGMRGGLAYVATKHAVVGMTKHTGFSYAQEGIRCVGVAPGNIATEIGGNVKNPDNHTLEKIMVGFNLLPVVGKTDNIANLYVFVASDDAEFINGTTIVADGGWTAY